MILRVGSRPRIQAGSATEAKMLLPWRGGIAISRRRVSPVRDFFERARQHAEMRSGGEGRLRGQRREHAGGRSHRGSWREGAYALTLLMAEFVGLAVHDAISPILRDELQDGESPPRLTAPLDRPYR